MTKKLFLTKYVATKEPNLPKTVQSPTKDTNMSNVQKNTYITENDDANSNKSRENSIRVRKFD